MQPETVQEWIQGFESHISQRFNRNISIVALEGDYIMDVESICKIVCHVSGVSIEDLKSNSRKLEVVAARHVAMSLAYKYVRCSLTELGKYFGDKNHTTVIHARKSVQDKLAINDVAITQLYKQTETLINKLINEKITE